VIEGSKNNLMPVMTHEQLFPAMDKRHLQTSLLHSGGVPVSDFCSIQKIVSNRHLFSGSPNTILPLCTYERVDFVKESSIIDLRTVL
jgi:hypothetical protein